MNSSPISSKNSFAKEATFNDEDFSTRSSKRIKHDQQTNDDHLQENEPSFNIKSYMWACSDCNKLFTSKSNLKVHLRVHTRIKPYHCKSCTYSCMHHSSIKEHLAKIHPGVVHTSTNPAYVFNSIAVPDPEQFNSADFNREAFIEEARQSNDKLVAQMSNTLPFQQRSGKKRSMTSSSSSNASPISNSSTSSNFTSPSTLNDTNSNESANEDDYFNDENSQSYQPIPENIRKTNVKNKRPNTQNFNKSNTDVQSRTTNESPKYTSFSINSILLKNSDKSSEASLQHQSYNNQSISSYQNIFNQQYVSLPNHMFPTLYPNQFQFFYNYLNHINQKQLFLSNLNFNNNSN